VPSYEQNGFPGSKLNEPGNECLEKADLQKNVTKSQKFETV
jgi:hypothetical protein